MYKITRVEVISEKKGYSLERCMNIYIDEEIQIEYFKDNEPYSLYPTLAYLHIAKLIDKKDKRKQTVK